MACGCGDWRKRYNLRLVHTTLRNMQRPAIGSCEIENFPFFCSDLQLPSPRRPLQQPATSVNKPYQGYTSRMVTHFNLHPVIRFTILSNRVRPFFKENYEKIFPAHHSWKVPKSFPAKNDCKINVRTIFVCTMHTIHDQIQWYCISLFISKYPTHPCISSSAIGPSWF